MDGNKRDRMKMTLRSTAIMTGSMGFLLLGSAVLVGCNANAWMGDPAAAGYYKPTPTTIPILDRIDIIEEPVVWPQLSKVTAADLMPSDLTYRIVPGDSLDVAIYGLYNPGQFFPVQRRVDQGGYFRIPEVGDILVAGLTVQAAQDLITKELSEKAMSHPSVQVNVLDSTGFTYTIYGGLARWGQFTLRDPHLLLLEALAQAGGVPQTTKNIYVIRQLPVSMLVLPSWDYRNKTNNNVGTTDRTLYQPIITPKTTEPTTDIEDLIRQLDVGDPPLSIEPVEETPTKDDTDAEIDALIEQLDIGDAPPFIEESDQTPEESSEEPSSVLPGILQTGDHALIDIDDLVPVQPVDPPVDVDELTDSYTGHTSDAAFIYVPESDSWIPVSTDSSKRTNIDQPSDSSKKASKSILERIIAIPWKRLRQGDSAYNIVVRPEDRIYVEPPQIGNLYIRGEIGRPGVYDYPITGHKITLSEFITAAGDLGPIAVPEKVSLTRRIGDNMEATVTLNFAGILQRTEPDIFLKPNDHISIGTSWGATPMAIIRNGFRSTYGFGFLLDRNFGNDAFGAPP